MNRFIINSSILVLLYIVSHYAYHSFTNDYAVTIPFVNRIEQKDTRYFDADIVTFGSSIEYMSHPKEKDKRSITNYLKELLPDKKIVALSQAAYTIELLSALMQYFESKSSGDQVYVIEVNLDQFSINDNKMFVDRTKERLAYEDGLLSVFYKPLSVFNYKFGVYSSEAYDNQKVYLNGVYKGTKAELDNIEVYSNKDLYSNKYMIQYLYELDNKHEKMVHLRKLIDHIKKKQLTVLFYLTPFDYQSCDIYFDKSICTQIIDENVAIVTNLFEDSEMHYIDLSRDLTSEHIASTEAIPNGHLKASGRAYVARKIANYLASNSFDKQRN